MTSRSLITQQDYQTAGTLSFTKNQLFKASQLVSQFIRSGINKFSRLFSKTKPIEQENTGQIQQERPVNSSFQSESPINQLLPQFSNQLYESSVQSQSLQSKWDQRLNEKYITPPHLLVGDAKSVIDASTQVYTFENTSYPMRHLFSYPDVDIYVEEQPESEVEIVERVQGVEAPDKQKQQKELQKYRGGSKKVKVQTNSQYVANEDKAKVCQATSQTQKIESYLKQIYTSSFQDLSKLQDQSQEDSYKRIYQEAEANYQKMIRKPRKIQTVRQIKEARRLMREIRSRQEDVEKRFQLYRQERKRRLRNRLKLQRYDGFKIENINPIQKKITVPEQKQGKIMKQQKKPQIQEINKDSFSKIQATEKLENKEEKKTLKMMSNLKQQQVKTTKDSNPFKQTVPKKVVIQDQPEPYTKKVVQNQLFKNLPNDLIKDKHIKPQKVNKKQENIVDVDLFETPFKRKEMPAEIQNQEKVQPVNRPLEKLKNIMKKQTEKGKQITTNQQQSIPKKETVCQTTKKVQIIEIKNNLQIQNPVVSIQQAQKVTQQPQQPLPKINPFLSSTPSIKLTINDIVAKNPQFAIFKKKESAQEVPQASQPSTAASIFMSGNTTINPFNFNQQPQPQSQPQPYSYPPSNPFAFNSNNCMYEQQAQMQSNNFMVQNQNPYMNQNYNQHFQQNIQQSYQNQGYDMNHYQQNNQVEMGYQPGMFGDPALSRTLFQSNQNVQQTGSLFESMNSSNNYNSRSNLKSSGSGRNKKPKDIRIT